LKVLRRFLIVRADFCSSRRKQDSYQGITSGMPQRISIKRLQALDFEIRVSR
jgi:hypothetical protein